MPFLAFDGEIKDRVTPKSGPGTPNPIALSATQCTENKELALWQRRKNVWLGLTAVKLAQGVGFVLHQRALGSGKWLLTVCSLLTVPPKGRGNSTQDPFAYTSIPQFGLKPRAEPTAGRKTCAKNCRHQKSDLKRPQIKLF